MVMETLSDVAARTDAEIARARAELVLAVRHAAADGMTQTEIARAIGRSQSEVNRILRFHGTTPRARLLREHARDIRGLVAESGGTAVRVFGSVATGEDAADSDIDLLFRDRRPLSLMDLGRLEARISELLGAEVDLVPESALRPDLHERVAREAVLL